MPNNITQFDDWVKSEKLYIINELQIKASLFVADLIPDDKKSIVPANIRLDNRFHYLDKDKKCGYIGKEGIKSNGVPFIYLTVNDFKETQIFDSEAIVSELWESQKSNQPYIASTQSETPKQQAKATNDYTKEAQKAQNVQNEITSFGNLSPKAIDNQAGYFDAKNIAQMLNEAGIRYGTNKDGEFGAILLKDIDDNPRGLQRFYANPIERLGDINKPVTWGMDKTGACYILGNIAPDTDSILFCTGLADGLVLYFVFKIPVVVCLDDNNLKHVVKAFKARYPKIPGTIVCDNDQWKYDHTDNSGVLKGVMAAKLVGYQYVIPEFADISTKPTDICDLYNLANGKDSVKSLLEQAKKAPTGHDWHLFKMDFIGLRNDRRIKSKRSPVTTKPLFIATRGLCFSAMQQTPVKPYDSMKTEVLNTIKKQITRLGEFEHFGKSEQSRLLEYVNFRLDKDYNELIRESTKKISHELIQKFEKNGGNVIHFELEKIDGKLRIPQYIADKIIEDGDNLSILAAQMNTGKTHSINVPLSKAGKLRIDHPILLTHLISLSKALSEKTKTVSYLDIKNDKEANDCDSVCACVNSGNKPRFSSLRKKSRLTIIDELDANYDSISIGTVPKREKKPLFDKIQSMLGNNKALVTSADIDDLALKFLFKTRKYHKIRLYISNQAKTRQGQKLLVHNNHNALIKELILKAREGQKLLIVADSVPTVESIHKQFIKLGINSIVITKNTSEKHADFLKNVNIHVNEYDAVLGSPSIAHGISFDTSPFDAVYGIYCQVATIDTFAQMISRDRNPKAIHIAFKSQQIKPDDLNERIKEAEQDAIATAMKTYSIVRDENDLIESASIPSEVTFSDFDKLNIATIETQAKEINGNVLLRRLIADGMSVEYVDHNKKVIDISTKEGKEIRKEYTQSQIDEIVINGNAELEGLDKQAIIEIVKEAIDKRTRTCKEKAAILRQKYNIPKVTEDIVKFDDRGGNIKLNRLEKALLDRDGAVKLDATEIKNLPTTLLSHNRVQQTFNNLLLNTIGLQFDEDFNQTNPDMVKFTGKSKEITKLVSIALKYQTEFNGAMPVKVTPKTVNAPLVFIRNWLDALAIKVKAERTKSIRNCKIDTNWLNTVLSPIQNRRQDGVDKFSKEINAYPQTIETQEIAHDKPIEPDYIPGFDEPNPNPNPAFFSRGSLL